MNAARPTPADLDRLDWLARLLDSRYRVPGTRIRFGLDSIVGLIPGVGDTLVAVPSVWMIWEGYRFGVPRRLLTRMAINTGVDYVIGSIPLVGDLFDLGFKANLRNAALLREALAAPARPASMREDAEVMRVKPPQRRASRR